MKPENNANLHVVCVDLSRKMAPHLSGFAPYTPVTVSAKTKPIAATEALAAREKAYEDAARLANEPFDQLLRRAIETIRDLSDDGFNPYGSGPEPIGRRV